MQYTRYTFTLQSSTPELSAETVSDLLSSDLADIGFDSFEWVDAISMLHAYILTADASPEAVDIVIDNLSLSACQISYTYEEMPDINWNEEWEKHYFQPIVIDEGQCVIRAPFHAPVPNAELEILISPRMAFGTGNHATTAHVMRYLLSHRQELAGAEVLDMGCGTGILGILALRLGAANLTAIDIDEWAYQNVVDNAELNGVSIPDALQGDANSLRGRGPYDFVLANITRNILLADMPAYAAVMKPQARLILSGFYREDIESLVDRGAKLGLDYISSSVSEDGWALIELSKSI